MLVHVARGIGAALLLLLANGALATELHFEAWPTASSEACPAPCYQMRMFLQVNPWDHEQNIRGIQMDVRIGDGAISSQLPVHPDRNDNAGSGNAHIRSVGASSIRVPWDVVSAVARSPATGFDGLALHLASSDFTVRQLAALVNGPSTSCEDVDECDFIEAALARNRVYLGFMNVTRGAPLPEFDPGLPHGGPAFNYQDRPRAVPFFIVYVQNIVGLGSALEAQPFSQAPFGTGFVVFMPEPSMTSALMLALSMILVLRVCGLPKAARSG